MSLHHIAHLGDWEAAQKSGSYEVSTRGYTLAQVGFVHASHEHQVSKVASFVYADDPEDLVVFTIDADAVAADGVEIREEDGGDGEDFPHIYGAIRTEWVTDVRPARFEDGEFAW